ncbi:MAG: 30S ribosomal protein S6 [Rhodospirillaceae bacterium]|nr:30S ribosomal protein S6 [Rhodospirillaceae bacterium]
MAFYESVVIARQDLTTAQVDTLGDELTTILKEGGANVTKRENWGLRQLSYRIKKNRKGHYLFFNVDGPAAAVTEYERRMRINEDVLRYLSVRVETLDDGPSAVLQNKDRGDRDRGDRGDRGGRFGGGFDRPRRDRDDGDRGGDRGGRGGHYDSGRRPRHGGEAPATGDAS